MKKATKKLLSFVLAGAMLTAMGASAFADEIPSTDEPAPTPSPTVHTSAYLEKDTRTVGVTLGKGTDSAVIDANHSYTAIKLLDLYKVMEPDTVTGDIQSGIEVTQHQMQDGSGNNVYQYGAVTGGLNLETLLNVAGGQFKYDAESGAITLANGNDIATQKGVNENTSDAAALAALIAQACVSNGIQGTPMTIGTAAQLECGYWVIFETANSGDDGTVATKPILVDVRTDGNDSGIALTLKDAKVVVDKTVTNADANFDHQDTRAIGDTVSYEIATNFPVYEANAGNAFSSLTFTIGDTLSDSLDLDANSLVVKVNGTPVQASVTTHDDTTDTDVTTVNYTVTTSAHGFTISFARDFILENQGEPILVDYSAKLNETAAYNDEDANTNAVSVTYSNNPEVASDTETITNSDNPVKVYTFAFDLRKYDGAHTTNLAGVKFNLMNNGTAMKLVKVDDNTYIYDSSLQEATEGVTTDIITVDGDITFIGLDEGTYTLHEVETVAGYSLLANDVVITITANTVAPAHAGEPATALTGDATLTTEYATIIDDDNAQAGETTSAVTALDGDSNLNVIVRNYKGINLPETGSIAALTISGLGLAVALAGAAFMVAKKKKDEE